LEHRTARHIGVNRNELLLLSGADTHNIVRRHELTHIKRWARQHNNTLIVDFGDHESGYWTIKSDEVEQIEQLIRGYIDILLKRQRYAKENDVVDDNKNDDESTNVVEDNVGEMGGIRVASEFLFVSEQKTSCFFSS
jgi:alkaline phosphatase